MIIIVRATLGQSRKHLVEGGEGGGKLLLISVSLIINHRFAFFYSLRRNTALDDSFLRNQMYVFFSSMRLDLHEQT